MWVPLVTFLHTIPQMEETIIMHIPALFCTILTAYFTTLMQSENFKNAVLGFSTMHLSQTLVPKKQYENAHVPLPLIFHDYITANG